MFDEEGGAVIVMCQGQPRCDREGEDAIREQMAGCPWCETHRLIEGRWLVERPTEQ